MKISAVVCRLFVRGVGAVGIAVALVAGCASSECARMAKENPLKVGVYVGAGVEYAPKGTVACASQDEVVRRLKELR